ncbi:MAG: O-antigen ligase family protein [Marinomonas sp.]|uniref:O-antigen ligase family protein n=1 Tax=Marinomonas sp. TaxID=1904862 RepID=UPI003F9E8726
MTSVSTSLTNAFKRRTPAEQPTWLILLGIISIALYALTRTGFSEIAGVASAIATLTGFWGLFKYGKVVNSHILFRFVWIAILFQLISWGLSQYVTPEWAESSPKLDKITRWFVFIPLAWWVAQYKNATWLVWGCAALGILVSPWVTGDGLDEIIRGINGQRIDFGIRNAQHTALYFGSILVGLCCFTKPLFKKYKLSIIPITFLIIYCLLVIYVNESRQAWLALIVTLLAISTHLVIKKLKKSSRKQQLAVMGIFLIGLATLSSILINSEKIVNRVMEEKQTISVVIAMDFKNVPYSSFGIRLHSWMAATDFIKEKPIFGWGSNGKSLVMSHSESLPEWVKKDFGHLHNSYLEILVNYGLVGIFFYFSIWVVIGKILFKEIKSGRIEKEIGYLFTSIFCFWTIMNCFESYQFFWTGVFYYNIFMAGIVGTVWQSKLVAKRKEN